MASASTIWALPTTNPTRHPGIEWPLVSVYNSTPTSAPPASSRLGGGVPVESEVGVGEVVDQEHLVLLGEADETLEEAELDAGGGGVVGNEVRITRGRGHEPRKASSIREKKSASIEWGRSHLGPGQHRGVDVDRVARVGDQGEVPRLHQRPHQVSQAFLGPDGADHLGIGVEVDPEAAPVALGDRPAQVGETARGGVPMVAWVARRLDQLVHHKWGAWDVRVAKPEVNDVVAGLSRLQLALVDRGEHIRRQPIDPSEIHGDRW